MSRPNLIRDAYLAGNLSPAQLIAFHRLHFGDARMEGEETPTEAPEGVTAEEWDALGDPGKRALVRERERATTAERERDEAKRQAPKPAPPAGQQATPPAKDDKSGEGDQTPDIAALIASAVDAALAPIKAEQQASAIRDGLLAAARGRLHDANDALAHIDLTTLTDGSGRADAAKITAALDKLATDKPHLVKPAAPGYFGGAAAPTANEDDQVKAALAKMQGATGVKLPAATP